MCTCLNNNRHIVQSVHLTTLLRYSTSMSLLIRYVLDQSLKLQKHILCHIWLLPATEQCTLHTSDVPPHTAHCTSHWTLNSAYVTLHTATADITPHTLQYTCHSTISTADVALHTVYIYPHTANADLTPHTVQ